MTLKWRKAPQLAGEPVSAEFCRAGRNRGLTRKTRTKLGTENGARPECPAIRNYLMR